MLRVVRPWELWPCTCPLVSRPLIWVPDEERPRCSECLKPVDRWRLCATDRWRLLVQLLCGDPMQLRSASVRDWSVATGRLPYVLYVARLSMLRWSVFKKETSWCIQNKHVWYVLLVACPLLLKTWWQQSKLNHSKLNHSKLNQSWIIQSWIEVESFNVESK